MKKLTLLALILMSSSITLFAQFKPMSGSCGFTGSFDGLANLGLAEQGTLGFRYYVADDMTGRLNLIFNSSNNKGETIPFEENGILNTTTVKSSNKQIGIGISKSMTGTARLEPYVGIDLIFGMTSGKSINRSEITNADSTFDTNDKTGDFYQTTIKNQKGISLGLVPCVGFNYYIAPLFALGGEFGWGFFHSGLKGGETVTEGMAGGTAISSVTVENKDTNKSGGFGTHGSASITFTVFFK